jgi:peptide deformylase
MILPVLTYPHPILAQCADPVEHISPEIRALAQDMVETMYSKEGIGLAAPQVGVSKRLIVVNVSNPDKREEPEGPGATGAPKILINPVIVSSCGLTESNEGCLSVLNFRAKVQRFAQIRLQALSLDGSTQEFDADGMLAICLQHEIDHLNGLLFIDHVSRLKRSLYEQKLKKWIKGRSEKQA